MLFKWNKLYSFYTKFFLASLKQLLIQVYVFLVQALAWGLQLFLKGEILRMSYVMLEQTSKVAIFYQGMLNRCSLGIFLLYQTMPC